MALSAHRSHESNCKDALGEMIGMKDLLPQLLVYGELMIHDRYGYCTGSVGWKWYCLDSCLPPTYDLGQVCTYRFENK